MHPTRVRGIGDHFAGPTRACPETGRLARSISNCIGKAWFRLSRGTTSYSEALSVKGQTPAPIAHEIAWEDLLREYGYGSAVICWRQQRAWQRAGVRDAIYQKLLVVLSEGSKCCIVSPALSPVLNHDVASVSEPNFTLRGSASRQRATSRDITNLRPTWRWARFNVEPGSGANGDTQLCARVSMRPMYKSGRARSWCDCDRDDLSGDFWRVAVTALASRRPLSKIHARQPTTAPRRGAGSAGLRAVSAAAGRLRSPHGQGR